MPWLLELQRLSPAQLTDPACKRSPRAWHSTPLATAVSILEAVLDDWELQAVVRWSFRAIAMRALGETVGAEKPGSLPHVATAATLLGSEGRATEVLLAWPDLQQALEWLLAIRRPRDAALKEEIPFVRFLLLRCARAFALDPYVAPASVSQHCSLRCIGLHCSYQLRDSLTASDLMDTCGWSVAEQSVTVGFLPRWPGSASTMRYTVVCPQPWP